MGLLRGLLPALWLSCRRLTAAWSHAEVTFFLADLRAVDGRLYILSENP